MVRFISGGHWNQALWSYICGVICYMRTDEPTSKNVESPVSSVAPPRRLGLCPH